MFNFNNDFVIPLNHIDPLGGDLSSGLTIDVDGTLLNDVR